MEKIESVRLRGCIREIKDARRQGAEAARQPYSLPNVIYPIYQAASSVMLFVSATLSVLRSFLMV